VGGLNESNAVPWWPCEGATFFSYSSGLRKIVVWLYVFGCLIPRIRYPNFGYRIT
jgi:hypothetical protein